MINIVNNDNQAIKDDFQNLSHKIMLLSEEVETLKKDLKQALINNQKNNDNEFENNKKFLETLFFSSGYNDLCYIQTGGSLFLFKREYLVKYYDFFKLFLLYHGYRYSKWTFGILDKDSDLYAEHIDSFKRDVVLHKYMSRYGIINHSIISQDDNEKLYMESHYLGLENYVSNNKIKYVSQPKREIIEGITLSEYLKDKGKLEVKAILRSFYDYLFENFSSATDKNKVQGVLLDAHYDNVLVNDDGFHFIDRDVIYAEDIKKTQILAYPLGNTELFHHFVKYYNLPEDNENYAITHPIKHQDTLDMQKAKQKNEHLFKRYFSSDSLKAHPKCNFKIQIKDSDIPPEFFEYIDSEWYSNQYPEIAKTNLSPAVHYMIEGWKLGYNPSKKFDTKKYLERYPDVAKALMNPLEHYVLHGKNEGRYIYRVES